MSLHLGNLSSRISVDDLQLFFRRFGKCTVRVKDRYGFVVFDYPANAEKALKALRGKRICGQAITLSWSNQQPRVFHRFPRGSKSYEPQVRKYSLKENADRRLVANGKEESQLHYKQNDDPSRNYGFSSLFDSATSYHPDDLKDYAGERDQSSSYDHPEVGVGKNHFEDERWREQGLHSWNENGFENEVAFDRYEPCKSDDKIEQEEYEDISPLSSSPNARKSQGNVGTQHDGCRETSDHPIISKSQKTCYACGELGHLMNNCPLKQMRSKSRGMFHLSSDVPLRHHENKRESPTLRNRRRLLERVNSPPRITPSYINKSEKRKYENYEKIRSKKVQELRSSSIRNHYNSSRSRSVSRSLSRSPSHSRPKFFTSKNNSRSSSLLSSKSQHSESKALESRSMPSTSLSLSVELDRDLSSSQNNGQVNNTDSTVNVADFVHRELLFEQDQCSLGSLIPFNFNNTATKIGHEGGTSVLEKEKMKSDLLEKTYPRHAELKSNMSMSEYGVHSYENILLCSEKEIQGSPTMDILEDVLVPETLASLRSNASSSVNMSSEEVYMVLKHYGLQYPEGNEKTTPLETYLGAARLWPWDIIYYRRLKKSPT